MIDVIIPAYNAHETIERTLYSIAYQRNSQNLNVYIINDNSIKDYSKEIDFFKNFINIRELKLKENSGPGYARQYGIEHSDSEYIIFIDSDDVFATPLSLITLENAIKTSNSDVVVSAFIEEKTKDKFIFYDNDPIALHGKIYKRKFIEKNKIKFPYFYAEEDNAFNHLIFLNNPIKKIIQDKTYIWMNNEKSLTRNENYKQNSILNYSKAMLYALENGFENKVQSNFLARLAYEALITIYYGLDYYNKNNETIKNAKKIKKIYDDNITEITSEEKIEILEYKIKCANNDGYIYNVLDPLMTFYDFLAKVEREG